MASFVLVHGGAHAAWCWERLVPFLQAGAGVDAVVAVDLPGHGARRDDARLESITVDDYVAAVVADIEMRNLSEVVLVGHSLAGITIPHVAARVPERMRRLVYLSTSNPPPGSSIDELMKHPLSPLSRGASFERMFCSDLDDEATEWVRARLGPEPPAPMRTPFVAAELPADLPITYVLLERDEALPPDFQREQARNAGVHEVVPFDAGHSAFLSRPRELAALLLGWA